MADTRIKDVAATILNAIVVGLEAEGIEVPTRRYTHDGEVAHDFADEDCASALIVTWTGTFQATGAGTAIQCAVPLQAQFGIALLRCVPTFVEDSQPPSAADLQAAADVIHLDAMTLPKVIIDAHLAKELTGIEAGLMGISSVLPVGPLGGVGGTQMQIVVSLV